MEYCRGYVGEGTAGRPQSLNGLKDMREHLSMADLKLKGSHPGDIAQRTAAGPQRRLWEEKDADPEAFQSA